MTTSVDGGARRALLVAAAIAALATAGSVGAQGGGPGGHGSGGHGQSLQHGTMFFDPGTIITVTGTVASIAPEWALWGHGNHTGGGMDIAFRADDGTSFDLMLAPDWFLQQAGIALSIDERITVTGSRVEPYDGGYHSRTLPGPGGMMGGGDGDDYLIATAIDADGVELVLRDRDGYPVWRGGMDGGHWFDPGTVVTLDGTLSELAGMWGAHGFGNHTGSGMHYVFEAAGDSYYAMLAPWWYLESQGLRLEDGMRALITGSVVGPYWSRHADRPYLIATELVVGGIVVALRDEWGFPLWRGTGWHYYSPGWSDGTACEVTGSVQSIRRRRHGRQLDKGYELMLRSGGIDYRVFVAPDWYVRHLGMQLRRGDMITIEGVVLGDGRHREIVVGTLDAGDGRWKLRTRRGDPLWMMGGP